MKTLTGHTQAIVGLDFSPDGKLLATGADDSAIRFWRASDGAPLRTIDNGTHVDKVVFSPDGHWLVSGGHPRGAIGELWHQLTGGGGNGPAVRIWRVSDGAPVASLPHPDDVISLALSPDGRWLVTGGEDNRFRLWVLRARLGEKFRVEDDPTIDQIGDARPERNQRALAIVDLDLEQVSRAVILDGDHRADGMPGSVDRRQSDEVGMIIFARVQRRQRGPVDLDQRAAQRLGGGTVGYAFDARDGRPAAVANREQAPFDTSDVEFAMGGEAVGAFAEQLEPQLALDAMDAGDGGKRNPTLAALAHAQAFSAAPSAGSSLDSPSPDASAGCGDSLVGGATSSAPSAGSAVDSP